MTTPTMTLGAFSISLAVKDLAASRDFYGKLGFEVIVGAVERNMMILRNGTTTIGLFKGMFERNMLTFNPGWDAACQALETFTDVRVLQRQLESAGITLATRADADTTGPASFLVIDPDGNPVLFDQHV